MGCDGGSIPTRIELVKTKQNAVRLDPRFLSIRPLKIPIVADNMGKLYNKEAVIEFLLDKKAFGDGDLICSHITKLRDVINLNLTPNPAFQEAIHIQNQNLALNPDDNMVA
ncbi:hypothetical protein HK096_009847, partial [Nowakowskiella sp. JEL0078]